MTPPSTKTSIKRLFVITVSTVFLTLFVIELVIRIVPLYPDSFELYDKDRGWVYEAGKSGTHLSALCLGEYSASIAINSHGLRDIERTYDKSPNTTRILMLGDSTVASFEVELDDAMHSQIEKELGQVDDSTNYEVLNGGHRGYGTDFEYLFYEQQAYQYDADLVVLVFQINNDFGDNHPNLRSTEPEYYPAFKLTDNQLELIPATKSRTVIKQEARSINPIHDALYSLSYLYRLLVDRNYVRVITQQNFEYQEEWIEEAKDLTDALILQLKDAVEANNSQFAVVVTPRVSHTNPDYLTHLLTFLDTQSINYLDLNPVAADISESEYRLACDGHWTSYGQEYFGKVIAQFAYDLLQKET